MKKIVSIILCAVIAVSCMSFSVSAKKISKPDRVNFTLLKRTGKSTVKLNWQKSNRASGYLVYMKTNVGSFKRIKITKSKSLVKSGLKIGNSYTFKIRAYRNYNGKKYYGKFSCSRKINMKAYVYLVDVIKPYTYYGNWGYEEYKGAEYLEMGGNKYYHGFILTSNYGETAYAIFNMNGKYSKMTFSIAGCSDSKSYDGGDKDLLVKCDDELTNTIHVKEYSLPKSCTVNLRNVYKLELSYFREYWTGELGFGNVKLYY